MTRGALLLAGAGLLLGLYAQSAGAATPVGHYSGVGTDVCLAAPGGFNSSLEPNDPASAQVTTYSTYWTVDFPTILGSNTGTFSVQAVIVEGQPGPTAGSYTLSGSFTLTSSAGQPVIQTVLGAGGKFTSGPASGVTFGVDEITLNDFLHANRTVDLVSLSPFIENLSFSDGGSIPRICQRSASLAPGGK